MCNAYGIDSGTFSARIARGFSVGEALGLERRGLVARAKQHDLNIKYLGLSFQGKHLYFDKDSYDMLEQDEVYKLIGFKVNKCGNKHGRKCRPSR